MKRSAVWKTVSRRGKGLGASLCALALAALAVWQGPQEAQAAYLDPYIERVTQLGLMRGDIDGNLMPESDISRAEFVTIVNRAFGYDEMGGIPFDDVPEEAWYAEDVDIGYTAGYITGTSESTFSPLEPVTREQAAVMLARNLVMQPAVGENVSFTDSRDLSAWSRGLVSTASQYNLISGYPDGSFHPQDAITRGEAAIMLLNAVGTPIQEPGVQSLGNVWGNVTITTSGVTLRDTVVGGNLYITAGVGLGDVILENVTVLGEIVVSGGGVSERGDDSVVLRNVNAPTLVVDNIRNQHVSLRVEGDGVIDNASIRTDAYLVDNTPSNAGVLRMELNGEEGLSLTLGGNIKEVINKTPESTLSLSSGQASVITVDEAATGSVLEIASGAEAGTVNLDTATQVTGDGDIGHLVVNAGGSTVSMLPDQITIRPGIDATIDGETMDSEAAAEASADPRLLAGYPRITDLAPTTATAQFSGNKRGTVYWAVTSVTDGSVGTGDLINPPSYTTNIVANGTVSLSGANEPATVQINRLTSDGSYYLSTVMVDARGDQSPLKVISFTTPDNSVPDFADGYPYLSRITNVSVQATVMATKTCRLYWAVLPDGASAPTAQDFRANAVTGNLGFGTLDVTKNTAYSFDANNVALEELEDYTLYLWLTDIGGGQSSRVESLDFTTVDRTPPRFNTDATVNEVERTSVGLYANLNEDGTLYWVVVESGETYPKPLAGQSGEVSLSSDTAKLQVSSGMNALKSGSVRMTEGKDVSFTVSGLDPEKAYDLYYVAQDTAGNYSATVIKLAIHTLDPNAPTVTQEFTDYNGDDMEHPLPSTDVRLVFNEAVEDVATNVSLSEYYDRLTRNEITQAQWANLLRNMIKFYVDDGNGPAQQVVEATSETDKTTDEWVIDYRYVRVEQGEGGSTILVFPTEHDSDTNELIPTTSALNLASGGTYYFEIQANTIADTSEAQNVMPQTKLDKFTTVFAIVNLSNPNVTEFPMTGVKDETITGGGDVSFVEEGEDNLVDVSWTLTPNSSESVNENVDWDMIIWTDTSVQFDLYRRENGGVWSRIGKDISITVANASTRNGTSLTKILNPGNNPQFESLNTLKENVAYDYAIHFTRVGNLTERDTWSQRLTIGVSIVAGTTNDLQNLANGPLDDAAMEDALENGITNIGVPDDFTLRKQFSDQRAPTFVENSPYFVVGDSFVEVYYTLDRPGTVYYVIAPKGTVPTTDGKNNFASGEANAPSGETPPDPSNAYSSLPERGDYGTTFDYPYEIINPTPLNVLNANFTNPNIKYDSEPGETAESWFMVDDLQVNTDYIAYFVIQSESSQVYSSQVYAYRFTTSDVDPAYIQMQAINPDVQFTTSKDANLYYALYAYNRLPSMLTDQRIAENLAPEYDVDGQRPSTAIRKMSLLEAMQATYDGTTGESIFDHYASDEIKEDVWLAITSQSSSYSLAQGNNDSMEEGIPWSYDFTEAMRAESGTTYICLATAQNRLGGNWSFKAVSGVRIPDDEPPFLTTVSTEVRPNSTEDSVSGVLILQFNEELYHLTREGDPSTRREIVQSTAPDSDEVGFLSLVTSGLATLEYSSESHDATRTISLKFWGTPVGATISFPNTGLLADANSNSNKYNNYVLRLQQTTDLGLIEQGISYEFVVIEGIYNGN